VVGPIPEQPLMNVIPATRTMKTILIVPFMSPSLPGLKTSHSAKRMASLQKNLMPF
jgi:hypothetical protein